MEELTKRQASEVIAWLNCQQRVYQRMRRLRYDEDELLEALHERYDVLQREDLDEEQMRDLVQWLEVQARARAEEWD